jgi:hypothetical protein
MPFDGQEHLVGCTKNRGDSFGWTPTPATPFMQATLQNNLKNGLNFA